MRRTRNQLLVVSVLLASACGTTVPMAQQQQVSGLGGPAAAPSSGSAPVTSGTSVNGGGATGTTAGDGGSAGAAGGLPGSGAPGSTTTGSSSTDASGIPTKGPSWDAKHVYIGIPTADDFNSVANASGINGSNGSTEGDVNAIVADINRTGGLLGRQVVPAYYDVKTTDLAYNPAATAQAICAHFTEDRPVVAVINGAPQLDAQDNFHRCLEKAGVGLLSFTNTDYDDQDYRRLGPHLWTVGSLSTDILLPGFVGSLKRQGFFGGWDNLNGKSASAPAKVGLLLPDTAEGHHDDQVLTGLLSRAGVPIGSRFFYDSSGLGSKSQSEVLQFKSAGVTHVLDLPPVAAEVWLFQQSAQQQHYRPRYGFTSFNLPLSMMENSSIVPPQQQIGSMGIGWAPYNDVDAQHDPGPVPGARRCLSALAKGGQAFNSTQRRNALIGVQFCDAIYLLRDALAAGKGFSPAALLTGMPIAGPRFSTAGTFRSAMTSTNHGVPGYYRDQHYDSGCSCFVYSGGDQRF